MSVGVGGWQLSSPALECVRSLRSSVRRFAGIIFVSTGRGISGRVGEGWGGGGGCRDKRRRRRKGKVENSASMNVRLDSSQDEVCVLPSP